MRSALKYLKGCHVENKGLFCVYLKERTKATDGNHQLIDFSSISERTL